MNAGEGKGGSPGLMAWIRIMSLDVVVGTLASAAAAQTLYQSNLPLVWLLVLGLSVWAIYSADHLMDAQRMGANAHSARHRYHYFHWNIIFVLASLAALAAGVLAFLFLGWEVIGFGAGMVVMTILHLLLVKWVGGKAQPWLFKELGVGLIYTLGIWGGPFLASENGNTLLAGIPIFEFFLIGMMNLLVFSIYERIPDSLDSQTSIVQAWGERVPATMVMVFGVLVAFLACLGISQGTGTDWVLHASAMAMAGIQLVLLGQWDWLRQKERYRAIGDAAFALPFLYVVLNGL
jgi:hypothetical protein